MKITNKQYEESRRKCEEADQIISFRYNYQTDPNINFKRNSFPFNDIRESQLKG